MGKGSHAETAEPPGPDPVCPDCGYDLSATRRAGRAYCPECGWSLESARHRRRELLGRLDDMDWRLTTAGIAVVVIVIVVVWLVLWVSGPSTA
jgi:predicted amidophosphoribosyltransferase